MKTCRTSMMLTVLTISLVLLCCSKRDAVKIVDIPVTTKSADAKSSLQQGLNHSDLGDNQKARDCFIRAIDQDPAMALAYMLKSVTDRTVKESADDLEKAKANLSGCSEWEKLYYEYCMSYLTSDWNKRVEIAQRIAGKYPDAARAQLDLGYAFSSGNQEVNARDCFELASEIDRKSVGAFTALANSFLFSAPKDFGKAESHAQKVVEIAPQSPGAHITLGDCYRAQNELEKARSSYLKAIRLDSTNSVAYFKVGHVNSFLGNMEEARENYTVGGKYSDSRSAMIMNIAHTYVYSGETKKAMDYLCEQAAIADASGSTADRIISDKMQYYRSCAMIAMHSGNVVHLKEMISLMQPLSLRLGEDAGTEQAKMSEKAMLLYWQSVLSTMEADYREAEVKCTEMKVTLEPINDPNKLDPYEFALGYKCLRQKLFKEALGHFEKTDQNSVYNKYHLALAVEATGKKEKARELLAEISDYNFNVLGYALIRSEVKREVQARE